MSVERGPVDPPLTPSQYRFVMGRLSNYYNALNDNPTLQPVRDAARRHLDMLDPTMRPGSNSGMLGGLERRLAS